MNDSSMKGSSAIYSPALWFISEPHVKLKALGVSFSSDPTGPIKRWGGAGRGGGFGGVHTAPEQERQQ